MSQRAEPADQGSDFGFVRQVGGVLNDTAFEKTPDFDRHLGFNRRADEEGVRADLAPGKGFVNPA